MNSFLGKNPHIGLAIRYVKGVHGGLPNIPAVYQDTFRCLREELMRLPDNVPEALSGHLAVEEASEAPHLDGTTLAIPFTDDPGFWNLDPPSLQRISALKAELENERLPQFTRVRLL